MRKHESLNLLELYALGSHKIWNKMLKECFINHDINRLAKLRYQVQAGMSDLAKQKMTGPEINIWYCRLIKSLEITAKRIIKIRHPLPGDNPLLAKGDLDVLAIKKKRDRELFEFLRRSSF